VPLPVSSFLQGASIAQMVSRVLHEVAVPAAAPLAEPVSRHLHEIRQVADDPVRRLLGPDKVSAGGTLS
jgi:hypothetical protein